MEIGILTFHATHNYGALLQTYALKRTIEGLGHKVSVINFYSDKVIQINRQIWFGGSFRQSVRSLVALPVAGQCRRRYARSEQFKAEHFNLTNRYPNSGALRRNPPEFDAVVCGSDQVWNGQKPIDPVWLLDFVKSGRKVAYAPSFGASYVCEPSADVFRRHLLQFDALSCREDEGVSLIRKLCGLNAAHVLDPTLLLDCEAWGHLATSPLLKEPYILVYGFDVSPALLRLVSQARQRLGLPVVVVAAAINRIKPADHVVRDAGPREFLSLFLHAAFVCTNSFHALSFSINCKKDFLAVPHRTRNSRLISLLRLLGLEERMLQDGTIPVAWGAEFPAIQYDDPLNRLVAQASHSVEYLKRALGE